MTDFVILTKLLLHFKTCLLNAPSSDELLITFNPWEVFLAL